MLSLGWGTALALDVLKSSQLIPIGRKVSEVMSWVSHSLVFKILDIY